MKTTKNYPLIEGWISVIINTLLFVLKYWAGIVTGSIALIADAWHTLTDSFSSIIVIVSAKISNKPADHKRPFGYGRTDLISSIIIGVLLAFIGIEFISKSINQLKGGEKVIFGTIAWVVTIISIIVKELLAQYAFWAGRKTDSQILKADGWHHRTDSLSSVIVLIGIIFGKYFWWIDGVLGIIVAIMIFYAAYEILQSSILRLMGETPDNETIEKIEKIVLNIDSNLGPHHYHIHKYGGHIELTFHVFMPMNWSLINAHEITVKIEDTIKEQLNIEATIHMEPDCIDA